MKIKFYRDKVVLAMSNERRDFIILVQNLHSQFLQHLIKILQDGKTGICLNHHIKEVNNFLKKIVSVRDKQWNACRKERFFFERSLLNQTDFLDEVNKLGGVFDDYNLEQSLSGILTDLYVEFLEKRKVPTNDWWKQKFITAWNYIERTKNEY